MFVQTIKQLDKWKHRIYHGNMEQTIYLFKIPKMNTPEINVPFQQIEHQNKMFKSVQI